MPSPEEIFGKWLGVIDNNFSQTMRQTFDLPADDGYLYRAESFAMTLDQIQEQIDSGKLKYKYQSNGQQIEVCRSYASVTGVDLLRFPQQM